MGRVYVLVAEDKDMEILSVLSEREPLEDLALELVNTKVNTEYTALVLQIWEDGELLKEEVLIHSKNESLYVNVWFPLRWVVWGILYTLLGYSIYLAFW